MPGLVAFGRRWEAGSDDLVFPAIVETFIRLVWCVLIIVVWCYHAPHLSCEGGRMLQVYLGGVLCLLAVTLIANVLLIRCSMRGTIMDDRPRRSVPRILYVKIALGVPEVAWTALGAYWAFHDELRCLEPETAVYVVRGLAVLHALLLLLILFGVAVVFDPLGHHHDRMDAYAAAGAGRTVTDVGVKRTRLWEWRCKLLCCSCFSGSQGGGGGGAARADDAFSDVAEVLTFLLNDLDLVPSDIAAALLLLHLRQQHERRAGRNGSDASADADAEEARLLQEPLLTTQRPHQTNGDLTVTASVGSLDAHSDIPIVEEDERSPSLVRRQLAPDDLDDWMNPPMAFHYMKMALGTYGWMWYLYGGFWKGLSTLWGQLSCCSCLRPRRSNVPTDDCCRCNLAALKTVTGLSDQDLLCVSFHNRVYEVPYFVAVDHSTSSVVVAIRGTLSFHDALTDLAAVTESIAVDGLPSDWTAHRGMLQAANYVLRQLTNTDVLAAAFAQYPDYHLVVTGHSLGAGAAVLLSIMLKPHYPKVRCFAFSPPGGLLSQPAARYTETFCMSVVTGDDLVPRLSLVTLELLKNQLVAELHSCRHPKYRIFMRGCWEVILGASAGRPSPQSAHPLLSESPAGFQSYESLSDARRLLSPVTTRSGVDLTQLMFLPGRILQVDQKDPASTHTTSVSSEPWYEARWMHREDYNQVLVTPRMLADHVPHTVVRMLRGLADQCEAALSGVSIAPHRV